MKPDDRRTLAALLLCLSPWLAVLVAVKLLCAILH